MSRLKHRLPTPGHPVKIDDRLLGLVSLLTAVFSVVTQHSSPLLWGGVLDDETRKQL